MDILARRFYWAQTSLDKLVCMEVQLSTELKTHLQFPDARGLIRGILRIAGRMSGDRKTLTRVCERRQCVDRKRLIFTVLHCRGSHSCRHGLKLYRHESCGVLSWFHYVIENSLLILYKRSTSFMAQSLIFEVHMGGVVWTMRTPFSKMISL